MTDLVFPPDLRLVKAGFHLVNSGRSGGPAWDGSEQIVQSLAAHWYFKGAIIIRSAEEELAARAFFTALDGRANPFLMPAGVHRLVNWPVDAQGRSLSPDFVKRYQTHLRDTAYEQPDVPSTSDVLATLNAAAAAGATQLAINKTQGAAFRAGQDISLGERMYRFFEIVSVVGNVTTVKIRPRLREAASSGASVEVTDPVCRMRAASDVSGPQEFDILGMTEFAFEAREDY